MDNIVEQYYDRNVQKEWQRLETHRIEFAVTWKVMMEFLPPHACILDVGGGPGRYSLELQKSGHNVTLVDLSQGNITYAQERAEAEGLSLRCLHGNALDLSQFSPGTFDVVLLMGPLYHLTDLQDRSRAIQEALRVLKPTGLLFASYITRYAFLIDLLKSNPAGITGLESLIADLLEGGIYKPSSLEGGFTEAFFIHPLEISGTMEPFSLEELKVICTDGLVMTAEEKVNTLLEDTFQKWVEICYRLGTDQIVWGTAEHMLYVGRKKSS